MNRTCEGLPARSFGLAFAALLVTSVALFAQQNGSVLLDETYLVPPEEVGAVVAAPWHLNVTLTDLSADGRWFLNARGEGLRKLANMAKPHYNLGGVQIDPRANRARSMTHSGAVGYDFVSWETGETRHVQLPRGVVHVSHGEWAPTGSRLAFFAHYEDATHIYVAGPDEVRARRVTRTPVLATRVTSFDWSADGRHIVTVLLPDGRGPEPTGPAISPTPRVLHTYDGETSHRTYPTLLEKPRDKDLLEYYSTGQLARIEVDRPRNVDLIGSPAMFIAVNPSPAAMHFRVRLQQRPFSYIAPVSRFASVEELWGLDGTVITELSRTALRDGRPLDDEEEDEEPSRRELSWRPDGQGMSFVQREPEPEDEDMSRMDRVLQWLPPYGPDDTRIVYESGDRLSSVRYSADCGVLFFEAGDDGSFAVFLDEPEERFAVEEPGTPILRIGIPGTNYVRLTPDRRFTFLSGTERSDNPREEAPRPYVDRLEIRTGERERIFESSADVYEQVSSVLDDEFARVITTRETATSVPNSYFRDLRQDVSRQLTDNADYTPRITHARRFVIDVVRADGFRFEATVLMPHDWVEGGPALPALFWFYPREYAETSDRSAQDRYDATKENYNKNQFRRPGPRSPQIVLPAGYAVVEMDAPIVGPEGRMNDNYVQDLRQNLAAVVDSVAARGFVDRSRLALGGHSYGAFGTVNALAHTPFFRAGIAGAGAYNRTLTPMGFQSERRLLWEARETYLQMSPFMWANQINGAILMYHGAKDQNTGTFPVQSWRLFHALNGLGKTAALYYYPYEDHGPASEETLLDMAARWIAWLDEHVKNATDEPEDDDPGGSAARR